MGLLEGSPDIFQDGNLPHETRLDRHFNKSSNSKRIAEGSPKAEFEKENNIDGPSQNMVHNKGHPHKKIIDNSHGESSMYCMIFMIHFMYFWALFYDL